MSAVFISGIVVFVLAAFVGLEVISKVPPTLHTPLMSGANAISGITIVGAWPPPASGRHSGHRPRIPRRDDRDDQRRRRLPGDRPHARDVQEEAGKRDG